MTPKGATLKGLPPSVMATVVMFLILIPAADSAIQINCSEPSQPSLLEALAPIFNLSAIRPVMNLTTRTNVNISFIMYGILGVDEKGQLLLTYLWQHFWWMNEFVRWDPTQCGSDKISLPRKKFWVPDIVINEFMDENTAPFVPYVYLYSDGRVHDASPIRVVSSCNLDIYTFPFDIQNCTMTFNSYIHLAKDIMIVLDRDAENITKLSKSWMTTMGEWELLDITSHHSDGDIEGNYIDELVFHVIVRRRATLYVVNLLIPSCFLITVDLFSFMLPPQTVDRSSFKMTLILGYTVFLLIMNDLLPITGNTIPLINVFFSLCLALMVTSLLETVLITNLLCGSADFSPVPRWVRVFVLEILGRLVCLPQKTKEKSTFCMKPYAEATQQKADGPPEEKGTALEDKALQELRSLGRDLQAIRLQVQQQEGSQSSQEWIQRCPLKLKPSKVLFIFISVLMHVAPCSSIMQNCSRPDTPSLLEALQPVFKLNEIRPTMNMSTPTNVSIGFVLFGILGLDEKAQVLKTYIWQDMRWRNEFVEWDPEQCGSSAITIPRKLLWVPDMVINEFMEKNSAPFVPYSYLYSNGFVLDSHPIRVISSCRLDIYTFPFDVQNCSLSFNSYLHRKAALQMDISTSVEDILNQSKKVMTTMGDSEAPGHPLCGEPADPQLLPHHSGPLQLPAAPPDCGPFHVQDDPHPGIHCLPAHHERPAAHHWKHYSSHKSVVNMFYLCKNTQFKNELIIIMVTE
ncbi:5-hydroxytryptamine receptor 3A-like isoform X3 [Notothenia coriiceps]|uniref:5-hydroxytryptamine receptor 3A-like isoform X3 n=1 Tax=Notothenia coriiceps TaxID=8208 RepID=A0A6I9NSV1_9TELE|nr:PREDICTED: 5-hydroxytryptamine receptor 3A-like isoform X3 [Notothenia coriiceps]